MDDNTKEAIYSIACILGAIIALAIISGCIIKEKELDLKYKQHQVK